MCAPPRAPPPDSTRPTYGLVGVAATGSRLLRECCARRRATRGTSAKGSSKRCRGRRCMTLRSSARDDELGLHDARARTVATQWLVHYHTCPLTQGVGMPAQHHRLIIVGSGPAGYTAAVYAARAALTPVIITGVEVGGQMTTTTEVDNWPGDDQGVMGPELMERMKRHAERFGTKLIHNHVDRVELGAAAVPAVLRQGRVHLRRADRRDGRVGEVSRACRPRKPTRAAACPRARPATGSSSATSPSPSSAAATRPSRKRCTSRTSRRASRSCTGATSSAPSRS